MRVLLLLSCLFLFASCSKEEDVLVSGNQAPPDPTIENATYADYITRTYILVLGREPDSVEYNSAMVSLKADTLSPASRKAFLDDVFSDQGYKWRQFDKWRAELLNNIDTLDVYSQITIIDFLLADSSNQAFWPVLQYEKDRLVVLRDAPGRYAAGLISIRELQSAMVNNYFYDQINMGAANFVISTFQHFFDRNPTASEQSNGVNMVNGLNAVLFLKSGSSKDDYLNIFFSSDDYFEGAVVRLYRDFLQRSPGSVEMSAAAGKYKSTLDYESVQKDILASDEFARIDN